MIWRSGARDAFLLVNTTDLTEPVWNQAEAEQPGAIPGAIAAETAPQGPSLQTIAELITRAVDDDQVRVEVSRRDRTLYVFLTQAQPPLLEIYLHRIHAAASALGLDTITQLKVVDGTEKRLLNRWHYDFDLQPQPQATPTPQAALPEATVSNRAESLTVEAAAVVKLRPAQTKGRSRRWRWIVLPTAIVLGFGLAAGATQWRYNRRAAAASAHLIQPLGLAERTATLTAPALSTPVTLTIKAVGDIIPGTDYQRYRLPDEWQYLFGSIQYHLGDADITFGNFESTLTEVPHSAKNTGRANTFAFRTPPWYASVLGAAGFDVLSVANNHSMDFFEQGFEDTIAHIEAAGMKAVGRKNEVVVVDAQGQRVAFIGFSNYPEHNQVQDLESAIALVQTAKQQADIVVVSFHAGKEGTDATVTRDQDELFYSENRGNVVRFSRTVIDHGADLVLGHGPHVPRAIELYNGKLIAYSLGNFLGYRSLSTAGALGTSLILQTNLNAQGDFVSGRIIPVALDRNGVPYLDDHFGGVVLVRQFTQRDFPDTPLAIDDLGYIWPR
ncbi:CapA family protein [Nodosilinea sp. LEGE 06152]|uniref:CapA family protein n=1 Tax=Nodosilinea sp. LEGE 06152 TaxID=2777966 RepID=UPI001D15DFC5|nr:CapA family protein [Nodosilinea sp. LEGE 06152]